MPLRPPVSRAARALPLALLLALGACANEPAFPTELTPEEERLVEEVLDLVEVRIMRARDEAAGDARRQELDGLYSPAEIEALLDELSRDPARAQLVVGAVHESLRTRRERLLPPVDVDR